jgi:hypothetical protein
VRSPAFLTALRLNYMRAVPEMTRYNTKLWMRDLKEGAAYLPK